MRIRRAVAAAAATAVIAPAAILAAPAAYATDGTNTTPTVEQTEQPKPETPAGPGTPEVEETEKPKPETPAKTEAPVEEETEKPEEEKPAVEETEKPKGETPAEEKPEEEKPQRVVTPKLEEPPGGEIIPEACEDADFQATLSGFPNTIVAGSGWHEFTLSLDNTDGEKLDKVIVASAVLGEDSEQWSDLPGKNSAMEYFDPEAGKWSAEFSKGGFLAGAVDLGAGQTVKVKLRLSVSKEAKPGAAESYASGVYSDGGNCALHSTYYPFKVLAPGSSAGDAGDSKPQGGKKPVDMKPAGDVKETGDELAKTGSDSQLPVFALAGAAAVALGGGALFVVRRRKGADSAA
ncbi:LPXTG cell wall anchor domain-containing protein [Streptomyces sp. JJ66]|uniref:LAETG motif-containing sortase-dependent surface protein n=1 Tax=Streptomyces sp. JJ66 TaxID=2803843 RepID=UPI001C56EDAF|nr:LAETG motif-containing sortase-dependent surface protein [Streptomyces sp. JJ66]MBW1602370.1 LPXTG cell wall anchor domain-containing protein [Streptomyces sp. JJ66]